MIELVQLERHHADFEKRNTRVLVASMEEVDDAQRTQAQFPHLVVLADHSRKLSEAAELVHLRAGPEGRDIDVPTTILIDRRGIVRWVYRSPRLMPGFRRRRFC